MDIQNLEDWDYVESDQSGFSESDGETQLLMEQITKDKINESYIKNEKKTTLFANLIKLFILVALYYITK